MIARSRLVITGSRLVIIRSRMVIIRGRLVITGGRLVPDLESIIGAPRGSQWFIRGSLLITIAAVSYLIAWAGLIARSSAKASRNYCRLGLGFLVTRGVGGCPTRFRYTELTA